MADNTQEILDKMIVRKEAEADLNGLTSVSQSALWRLIMFVCASAINEFETLKESFLQEIKDTAKVAISGTSEWWQSEVLKFQYDETPGNEQVVQELEPGIVGYPITDSALQVVSRASVTEQSNRRLLIKVAVGEDDNLGPASAAQIIAIQDYSNKVGWTGIPTERRSEEADRLRIDAKIYFSGQFVELNVKTNVILAIQAYLASISVDKFDGTIVVSALIDAIQSVDGVNDVDSQGFSALLRKFTDLPGDNGNILVNRRQETFAGYVVTEDETGVTLEDTLTFILE